MMEGWTAVDRQMGRVIRKKILRKIIAQDEQARIRHRNMRLPQG